MWRWEKRLRTMREVEYNESTECSRRTHRGSWRETAYFNMFKGHWKRVHDACLRALPLVDECDLLIRSGASSRLSEDAKAVVAAIATSDQKGIGGGDTTPSIWSFMMQPQDRPTSTSQVKRELDTTQIEFYPRKSQISPVERTGHVDQTDRRRVRGVLGHLQIQGSSIASKIADRLPPLPKDIPFILRSHTSVSGNIDSAHRTALTITIDLNEEALALRVMENTWKLRFFSKRGSLATRAREVVLAVSLANDAPNRKLDALTCDIPSIFQDIHVDCSRTSTEKAPFTDVSGITSDKDTACTVYDRPTQRTSPCPVKFDGFLKKYSVRVTLKEEASQILKNAVKKNVSILLSNAVPVTLSKDIGSLLRRASSSALINQSPCTAVYGLQQRSLPSEVTEDDRNRVEASASALVDLAVGVIKSLKPPPVSSTSLSIALPSIWRHEVTTKITRNARASMWGIHTDDSNDKSDEEIRQVFVAPTPPDKSLNATQTADSANIQDEEMIVGKPQNKVDDEPTTAKASNLAQLRSKVITFAVEENVTTDELVSSFLRQVTPESLCSVLVPDEPKRPSNQNFRLIIDNLARPAIWFLSRMKMLRMTANAVDNALKSIPLQVLEAITIQLHSKLKTISANPTKTPVDQIINTCTAFRSSAWLHALRMTIECDNGSRGSAVLILSRLLLSSTYRATLGHKHVHTLSTLHNNLGGKFNTSEWCDHAQVIDDFEPTQLRPPKKMRHASTKPELNPVRVLCSLRLLENDGLLEAMADQGISVIERDLPSAIDVIVDEHNAIVFLQTHAFTVLEENLMKMLTFELAESQLQFETIWLIADAKAESEPLLHSLYAALANFTVCVQTFVCDSDEETAEVMRGIIDACAETALSKRRQLPKMWFARPFMLEEESQLERFLSSTRALNAYAAQSALHKLSMNELSVLSLEEFAQILQGSLTQTQASLLWRFLHSNHGIGAGE